MSNIANADSSLLLWLLGAFVFALALHLSNGWLRRVRSNATLRSQWRVLLIAACALGTGIVAALILGMQAQPLNFPIGYQWWPALLLWLAAMLLCLPAVSLTVPGVPGWRLFLGGTLLALLALAQQAGWLWAAGFRPGLVWRKELLAGAAVLLIVGMALGRWMSFSAASATSERSLLWHGAGVALTALTLMAGQEVMGIATLLAEQRGSIFERQIAGSVLSLVLGVLVPLTMLAMVLDLWLRNQQGQRRGHRDFNPKKRGKRRHRIRTL